MHVWEQSNELVSSNKSHVFKMVVSFTPNVERGDSVLCEVQYTYGLPLGMRGVTFWPTVAAELWLPGLAFGGLFLFVVCQLLRGLSFGTPAPDKTLWGIHCFDVSQRLLLHIRNEHRRFSFVNNIVWSQEGACKRLPGGRQLHSNVREIYYHYLG